MGQEEKNSSEEKDEREGKLKDENESINNQKQKQILEPSPTDKTNSASLKDESANAPKESENDLPVKEMEEDNQVDQMTTDIKERKQSTSESKEGEQKFGKHPSWEEDRKFQPGVLEITAHKASELINR